MRELSTNQTIEWPCLVWPKPYGVRCHTRVYRGRSYLYSYSEGLFLGLEHIVSELAELALVERLDGFLVGSTTAAKEALCSILARTTVPHPAACEVEYLVYDYVSNDYAYERVLRLSGLLREGKKIRLLKPSLANDLRELCLLRKQAEQAGYEGTIVRNMNTPFIQNWTSPF